MYITYIISPNKMDSTIKKSNEKPINILLKNDLKKKNTSTVPKSNRKILETTAKSTSLTHIYMTAHFAGLMQALQYQVATLN